MGNGLSASSPPTDGQEERVKAWTEAEVASNKFQIQLADSRRKELSLFTGLLVNGRAAWLLPIVGGQEIHPL